MIEYITYEDTSKVQAQSMQPTGNIPGGENFTGSDQLSK